MRKPTAAWQLGSELFEAVIHGWQRMTFADNDIDDGRLVEIQAGGEVCMKITGSTALTGTSTDC